jgi:hypothetical protein
VNRKLLTKIFLIFLILILNSSLISAQREKIDFADSELTIYLLEKPSLNDLFWIVISLNETQLQITQSQEYLSFIQIDNLYDYYLMNENKYTQEDLLNEIFNSVKELLVINYNIPLETQTNQLNEEPTFNPINVNLNSSSFVWIIFILILVFGLIFLLRLSFKLNKKQPTVNIQLKEYVRSLLSQGYSQVDIKNNLISQGYPEKEIEQIFQALK